MKINNLYIFISILLLSSFSLSSCKSGNKGGAGSEASSFSISETQVPDSIRPRISVDYADGFSVEYLSDRKRLVTIQDPQRQNGDVYKLAFIDRGTDRTGIPEEYSVIEVPVRKSICMTSLQLSNFIKLDALDFVTGVTSTNHLFNTEVADRLKEGKIIRIGIEGNFDNEAIMVAQPDLILISPFKRGGFDALKEVGIPLVPHLGYKEMTPLGQAEWIKFVAILTGQEEKANKLFKAIADRYNELVAKASAVKVKPEVFSGEMRGGNWYAVGGKSFLARLFEDAGAEYFLKEDTRSGGVNLDYETVYSKAADADFWRIVNSYQGDFDYDALAGSDNRYTDFKAFRDRKIIYCNMRLKPFYESMPVEPEIVLADLIKIFHPDLLPDYSPKYYELLEDKKAVDKNAGRN